MKQTWRTSTQWCVAIKQTGRTSTQWYVAMKQTGRTSTQWCVAMKQTGRTSTQWSVAMKQTGRTSTQWLCSHETDWEGCTLYQCSVTHNNLLYSHTELWTLHVTNDYYSGILWLVIFALCQPVYQYFYLKFCISVFGSLGKLPLIWFCAHLILHV